MTAQEPSAHELAERIATLIIRIGERGFCKGCGVGVFWIRHRNGKLGIYNPDGISHYATCPKAEQFRYKTEVE